MTLRRSSQSHTDLAEIAQDSVPSSPITISKPSLHRSASSRIKARIRPWSLAVAGRWKGSFSTNAHDQIKEDEDEEEEEKRRRDGYEWEVETGSESEPDGDGDGDGEAAGGSQAGYSWVDPSVAGSHALRRTPGPPSETEASTPSAERHAQAYQAAQTEEQRELDHSLALLTAYQSLHSSATSSSHSLQHRNLSITSLPPYEPSTPASPHLQASHSAPLLEQYLVEPKSNSEWHELVPQRILGRIGRKEMKRQGLIFELIRGEREYARDLSLVCEQFITPLTHVQPPVLHPENRMNAFLAEVFSTTREIERAHRALLEALWERQREQWPLISSITDLILNTMLDAGALYETYIKNYPYAEARVRRETSQNPAFRAFLTARNTNELTSRRDVSVFLSRPLTRLPRLALMLETVLESTPSHHADQESIPTALAVIKRILKSSQPGIESAESKVKLWDVAETLLFRKGEIIELDIAAPQRTLVHSGYVFRRVRSETNWHGWQDLHAFLLDNYFLLTRDEENGKHVVVSRPIHLDFLHISAVDGVPERRYDGAPRQRKPSAGEYMMEPVFQPERLMYPFTITAGHGENARSYTLCTATQGARQQWHEKIDGAKTLRKFDIDSNRLFAVHPLFSPAEIVDPIQTVETFYAFSREAVAIATTTSVWVGFKRDSRSFRQVIKLHSGTITAMSIVPDFPWLVVLSSGNLLAFSLSGMLPASDPSTWALTGRAQAEELSRPDVSVAVVKMGITKGRLLVVFATYLRNTHHTMLYCLEPLIPDAHDPHPEAFRAFADMCIPGYVTDLYFFKQTISAVNERGFVVCEPGNVAFNVIPVMAGSPSGQLSRLIGGVSQALCMCQISDDEFLLVYNWGACFVTQYGEIARSGTFLRWNVHPSFAVHRAPYLLLFDESASALEVRHIGSGRLMEVLSEPLGLQPVRTCRTDRMEERAVLCLSGGRRVLELVETIEL